MPKANHLAALSAAIAADRDGHGDSVYAEFDEVVELCAAYRGAGREVAALTPTHLMALAVLCGPGADRTIPEIAESIDRSASQAWRLIGLLIERGLVKRKVNHVDARRHLVVATPTGLALDQRVQRVVSALRDTNRGHTDGTDDIAARQTADRSPQRADDPHGGGNRRNGNKSGRGRTARPHSGAG